MTESYVERWAKEQKAKAQSDKVEKVQKEKGKVKDNGKNTRGERQETEEDNRTATRDSSRSEP